MNRILKTAQMPRKPKTKKTAASKPDRTKHAASVIIPPTIKFHNLKSHTYHSVQADGAWGTLNPHGLVHLTFYNERSAIPTESVHEVTPDGKLGKEVMAKRVGKDGVVRQLEVDVILPLPAAIRVRDWLNDMLAQLSPQTSTQQPQSEKSGNPK